MPEKEDDVEGYWPDGCWPDNICAEPNPTTRIDLDAVGSPTNTIMCWPSVGGMIIVDYISSVEFRYLGLDHLKINQRSYNTTEEDHFCQQLRRIGGKWWESYWDRTWATEMFMRRMSPIEKEVLHIGWPETGGVWLLRFENKYPQIVRRGTPTERMYNEIINNATTMEERWRAIKSCGGEFFEDPRDSEYIKPLLDGFGEHEEENNYPTYEERNEESPQWLLDYIATL
ncbi:hypothetical protein DL98DRAFT_652843 [Cadophora sp. DSE1049]|nr:hypothetical protein DL98DRAFT_652843 [Cadophora sp. DSE1049]